MRCLAADLRAGTLGSDTAVEGGWRLFPSCESNMRSAISVQAFIGQPMVLRASRLSVREALDQDQSSVAFRGVGAGIALMTGGAIAYHGTFSPMPGRSRTDVLRYH